MPLTPFLAETNYVAAIPRAFGPPSPQQAWRPPRQDLAVGRSYCYYCGIREHISRFGRWRQPDERHGYASYDRDGKRFSYGFDQQHYTSPPRLYASPLGTGEYTHHF